MTLPQSITRLARMPFSTALGIILGVISAMVMPQMVGFVASVYDGTFPVLRMQSEVVSRDRESITLHIWGRKLRGEECRLVRVYAYTVRVDGRRFDALADRVDMKETGRIRSDGEYDIGFWRVFPVDAVADRVEIWTHHNCVGRDTLTLIADVSVPP